MYTSKQHTSIIMVSSDYYNMKVKLAQKVSRTSTEVLFTCLNAVHQFKLTRYHTDTAILHIIDMMLNTLHSV